MACLPLRLLLALGVLGLPPSAGATDLMVEADAGVVHDDNVGRSQRDADREGDSVAGAGVRVGRPWRTGHGIATLDVTLRRDQPLDWTDLGRSSLALRGAWRTAVPGPGSAGFVEVSLESLLAEHDDSDLRDGVTLATGLVVGRRLAGRTVGRAGYRYERRRGGDAGVFDTDQHRVFLDVDIEWRPDLTLYGTGEWRTGDVVSTATADPAILAIAEAAATDEALAVPGRRRVAYRLDGTSALVEAGANLAIAPTVALDASVLYHDTQARGGNAYHGVIGQVSVLWRWR